MFRARHWDSRGRYRDNSRPTLRKCRRPERNRKFRRKPHTSNTLNSILYAIRKRCLWSCTRRAVGCTDHTSRSRCSSSRSKSTLDHPACTRSSRLRSPRLHRSSRWSRTRIPLHHSPPDSSPLRRPASQPSAPPGRAPPQSRPGDSRRSPPGPRTSRTPRPETLQRGCSARLASPFPTVPLGHHSFE